MAVSIPLKGDPWTVDDLPEEGCFEIVDGALVMSPPPSRPHEAIVSAVHYLLAGLRGPQWVFGTGGIEFDAVNYRVPDVTVLAPDVDPMRGEKLVPADVLLVVEVVSPSSVSTDHVAKRDQYARAGIANYWIVEFEPELTLTTLSLRSAGAPYAVVGRWREGDRVELTEPFPLAFELSALRA